MGIITITGLAGVLHPLLGLAYLAVRATLITFTVDQEGTGYCVATLEVFDLKAGKHLRIVRGLRRPTYDPGSARAKIVVATASGKTMPKILAEAKDSH